MDLKRNSGAIVFALVLVVVAGTSCVELTISPRRATKRPGENVIVSCRAPPGMSLKSCRFYISGAPGIDLRRGRDSEVTADYRYAGRGLESGYCGINLLRFAHDFQGTERMWTITCAAQVHDKKAGVAEQNRDKGWAIAYMSLFISRATTVDLVVDRPRIVVSPGTNVSILCQSEGIPLTRCLFQSRHLNTVGSSEGRFDIRSGSSVQQLGSLDDGDCGVTLVGVTDEMSGLIWCAAKSDHGLWGYDFTELIVRKSPSTISLELNSNRLNLGEPLAATCTIQTSRPAAVITWDAPFDRNTRELHSDDILQAKFRFEDQAVVQQMVKNVTLADHLKVVQCSTKGIGNTKIISTPHTINVKFCGKRNIKGGQPLLYGGVVAQTGEYPWHVAIYKKANSTHSYICGGSLIASNYVISAAHCFWDPDYKRPADASSFAVAAGKHTIGWDSDVEAQRMDVDSLNMHEYYSDDDRQYEDDIAVLKLNGEVVFSRQVHPVCIGWRDTLITGHLAEGDLGIVPGWGYSENRTFANDLRYVEVPYMTMSKCRTVVPSEFRRFLTPHKFCAGYVNGSLAICLGDSGGGIVFYKNSTDSYVLRGIVSVAPWSLVTPTCNHEQITSFTSIEDYLPWIKTITGLDNVA